MAEDNRAQESEQEQEQGQDQVQVQAEELIPEPVEQQDEPVEEKSGSGGLLMPILYALLAAVGAFTLVMIIGIVVTLITRPSQSSKSPGPSSWGASPSQSPVQAQTQSPRSPDSEGSNHEIPYFIL